MMKEMFLTPEAARSSGRFISYGARRSLLLAGLSFSALLTIMAPIAVNQGLHITLNQAWADSEGGDGGEGGGGGGDHGGDGGDHGGDNGGDGGDNGDHGGDNGDSNDDQGDNNDDQGDNGDDQGDNGDDSQDSADATDEQPDDIPPPAQ